MISPRSRLRATLAGLPRAYGWLWAGTLVNRLGSFVVPFLALYLTRTLHFSVARTGWIISLYGAGAIASGPVAGFLSDRIGRKPVLLLALGLGGLGTIVLGYLRSPTALALMTLTVGFVERSYWPPVSAMITDLVSTENRSRAFNHLYWAINLGFSLAVVVAGLLASRSWLLIFWADGLTSLAFMGIVWVKVPETRPKTAELAPGEAATLDASGGGKLAFDPDLVAFVVLVFLGACIYAQSGSTLPIEMGRHGISDQTFGLLLATNTVMIVLLQPFATGFLGRFRRARVLAVATLLTGLGFMINAWADGAALYMAGIAVWTLGEIASFPLMSAIVSDLAPAAQRGRYHGLYALGMGLASFVGPLAGALLLDRWGSALLWWSCGALGAGVALAHLGIAGSRRRRLASRGLGQTEDALRSA